MCKSNQSLFVQEFVLTYIYFPLNNCTISQQHVQCGMCSALALFLPLRELKSRINICSQSCNNIYDTLNKCSAPQRGIINSLKTSCLKTNFKANTAMHGNAFVVDLFKYFLNLKIYGGFEAHKLSECYGPGIWNIKQKDNKIDQNNTPYMFR